VLVPNPPSIVPKMRDWSARIGKMSSAALAEEIAPADFH